MRQATKAGCLVTRDLDDRGIAPMAANNLTLQSSISRAIRISRAAQWRTVLRSFMAFTIRACTSGTCRICIASSERLFQALDDAGEFDCGGARDCEREAMAVIVNSDLLAQEGREGGLKNKLPSLGWRRVVLGRPSFGGLVRQVLGLC